MSEKYILTMDRETAQIVRRACEFYSRAVCGQIDEILLEAINVWSEREMDDTYFAIREQLEDSLKRVKALLFPELPADAHYGVGHHRNADLAWNTNQVLRHGIAWHDNPKGGYSVDYDKPVSCSGTALPSLVIEEKGPERSE